jgi:hypothetical protein
VRGVKKVFVLLDLSLGHRPGMRVLSRPKRAARMNEKDLQPPVSPAVWKQPCARPWHLIPTGMVRTRTARRSMV